MSRPFALKLLLLLWPTLAWTALPARAAEAEEVEPVAGQPLAANVRRLLAAWELLGTPLPAEAIDPLRAAADRNDGAALQLELDPRAVLIVELNPESRVKVRRGPGKATLQQAGFTPLLVKVINHSTVKKELHISSPQAGPVYAGMSSLSAQRLQREPLRETQTRTADPNRFLELEMFTGQPMTAELSGLEVEYALALLSSTEAGRREATIGFDVGQGTQDLGFRAEVPVLFDIRPALRVRLRVQDHDGRPTTAGLVFRDGAGHIFPPQAKRLAPDLYFQPQVYRADGEEVMLPPGKLTLSWSRGPEYLIGTREIEARPGQELTIRLQRWFDANAAGFFSGDHHIHGAGCAHYTSPTEGVTPADMFRQVTGEGLNVGCVLTWGPCFDYQRRFFSPGIHQLSDAQTVLKYDLEISGFGSEALGHVCLLNLTNQTYPRSDGTKARGWPSWTVPVLRWAKQQGAVTGYAHSGSGLEIQSRSAARRFLRRFDQNQDGVLSRSETAPALLPGSFDAADFDHDGTLAEAELVSAHERAAEQLPNLAVPEMNGVGAMELPVSLAAGVCDFISAMDTPRIAEWNMWYHMLNCGLPLKASGETDFPCMSGERVGQGRVYVALPKRDRVEFKDWCANLAQGRSYVSDGFAHAPGFTVNGAAPGFAPVHLTAAGDVEVHASVAFAPSTPSTVAQGLFLPEGGRRFTGDTVTLHGPRRRELAPGGERWVELVVNSLAVASNAVPADGRTHELHWRIPVTRSSWVALRQFPQFHTNPVEVRVGDQPIRASRTSARWAVEVIERLWEQRSKQIQESERAAARQAYDEALAKFRRIAEESPGL